MSGSNPGGRRRQLSLFVAGPHAAAIEHLRRTLDPVQAGLIPAHVTLCREDELTGDSMVDANLLRRVEAFGGGHLTLEFGRPEHFMGHGILLPCLAGHDGYYALREQVLGGAVTRRPSPHLTLAHPRNPRAPGNDLAAASGLPVPLPLSFAELQLIEQESGGPWCCLRTWSIPG